MQLKLQCKFPFQLWQSVGGEKEKILEIQPLHGQSFLEVCRIHTYYACHTVGGGGIDQRWMIDLRYKNLGLGGEGNNDRWVASDGVAADVIFDAYVNCCAT